jgi:hypothetical protein
MAQYHKSIPSLRTALQQVRNTEAGMPIKDSKKLYIRACERRKVAAEIRAVSG